MQKVKRTNEKKSLGRRRAGQCAAGASGTTPAEYTGLSAAFDFMSAKLFDGELPEVFIVYTRRARTGGYYAPARFVERTGERKLAEIGLNPDSFIGRTDEWIISTLVHEMCHHWQQVCGTSPSKGYHDAEWADKMEAIGLMPSSTGEPGGKRTGSSMSDYIIKGGAFAQAFIEFAATGWKLNLELAMRPGAKEGKPKPVSKVKSTCPSCGGNGWSKPKFYLACVACRVPMIPEFAVV